MLYSAIGGHLGRAVLMPGKTTKRRKLPEVGPKID